jgi:hypothetical protein
MLGIYYRDEKTKLRYRVVEIKKITGQFESPSSDRLVYINEMVVILECNCNMASARGFFSLGDGFKLPIKSMTWLSRLEYSQVYFKQLIKRGKFKKITV